MSKDTLLREFWRYAAGELSLNQLEEWILSNLQSVLDSGDEEAISVIDEADASLLQLNANEISEIEFFDRIAGLLRRASTDSLSVSFGSEFAVISVWVSGEPTSATSQELGLLSLSFE